MLIFMKFPGEVEGGRKNDSREGNSVYWIKEISCMLLKLLYVFQVCLGIVISLGEADINHKHWIVQKEFVFDILFFFFAFDLNYCFFYLHWINLLNSAGTKWSISHWQFQGVIETRLEVFFLNFLLLWITHLEKNWLQSEDVYYLIRPNYKASHYWCLMVLNTFYTSMWNLQYVIESINLFICLQISTRCAGDPKQDKLHSLEKIVFIGKK